MVNHRTGDRCHLKFAPYSYFSRDIPRKVGKLYTVCKTRLYRKIELLSITVWSVSANYRFLFSMNGLISLFHLDKLFSKPEITL